MTENLDLVRSIYAAWGRGDFGSVEWADPEIEWVTPDGPSPGTQRGLSGMAEAARDIMGPFEGYRTEANSVRELDDERVLVLSQVSARGKESGVEVARRAAGLWHIRDGKVTRIVAYWNRDRALADLGLAPETEQPPHAANQPR